MREPPAVAIRAHGVRYEGRTVQGTHVMRFDLGALFSLIVLVLCATEVQAAQLRLSWTDNSDNERGFSIERRLQASGTFASVATQEANVPFYSDTTLLPATAYCYRVLAFNEAGQSPYSNESCATTSTLEAAFEGPSDTQSVASIGVVRGWAFDVTSGMQVKEVKLLVDEAPVLTIPCCSPRGDVQAVFPQFPAQNTLNSGWGTAVNWGVLESGTHVVQLDLMSTSGKTLLTEKHTVTSVRLAGFSFVDLFSLAQANVRLEGNDLVVEGSIVREKDSQRQARVNTRFRWLTNEQAFQLIASETIAQVASLRSVLSPIIAELSRWITDGSSIANAQVTSGIFGMIESPGAGQIISGISVLRGWAFSDALGATIQTMQVAVDGQSIGTLPCCSGRGDVAALFPNYPTAVNSGWGAVVNYGGLETGPHTISVQITDSRGVTQTFERGFETIRVGDATFVDDLSLADATPRIEGNDIVVSGVRVRDKATQEVRLVTLRLRWSDNAQTLGIVASSAGL